MRGWHGVGLVAGWQTVASLCFYAIFAATAFLRSDFGLSRTLVGVTITVTMLGYTLLLFVMGAAVDGYGERRVMVGGLLGLAVGAAGVAIAPSYPLLLLALLVLGGAYATAMPATNRAVLAVAPPGRRNLTMSIKQVGVTVGSGLGAILVTWMAATRVGWRGGFFVATAVGVGVALAFGYWYRGDGGTGSMGLPDVRGLLARPDYRLLVAAGFFYGAAILTTTAYVVLYLTESVGAAAGVAGTVLALVQLTGSAGRIGGGALVDRLPLDDARASALVLVGQSALGVACLVAVTAVDTPLVAAVGFAVLGLFVFGIPATYYACMTALVPSDRVGEATAGGQLTINAGGLIAPPTFGYLVDTAGYTTGWLALAAGVGVAALLLGRLALLTR
ncbi:MFS transporter [Haloplanus aerogenes]|uniref:MFS transporter n=1 Tax=Haloplanus aerogenes TaxID=660522 RepID=A0A3M0DVL6_9EURY|nr:MFS transporter [Haloplanus aerogenes]AZH25425.1 MFS transporter [Haloplanus aerogenes]RMB25137.1 sugar phosphate permease [Haloplanus aerogenes]